ncbi:MAG: helix-turn-helix transcriptional regulator [Eubacteriales bacterium]
MGYDIVKNPPELLCAEHMTWEASAPLVAPRAYGALSLRVRGSAQIKISDRTFSVKEGSLLYLPQETAYAAVYDDTEILCFHFRLSGAGHEPKIYENACRSGITPLFWHACRVWRQKDPGYELQTLGLFYQVLAAVKRLALASESESEHFSEALGILNREFTDPTLRIAQVCRRAGLCETAFRAQFRRCFGKTPVAYLTERRLEQARWLLMQRSVSVERAAAESGFGDAKYFSRVVKKVYGCTPSALRGRFV